MKPSTIFLAAAAVVVAATGAQAQVSDDVVKIGVINDQAGMYSDITGAKSIEVVKMAIEDFGGKVLGKSIEIVTADHQNKADTATAIASRWIDQEKVDALADSTGSGIALALQEVARSSNRMLLVASAATSDFTGKACAATGTQWSYDTYALAKGTARETTRQGGDTWFFLTADYAFGHALERDSARFVEEGGGKVLGAVRAPLGTHDYSSFLLQAQASQAKIIGLATASTDTINAIKQAGEFNIVGAGQRLGGLLVFINDIESLGLPAAQGLMLTTSFYWDLNDETRAWTKRFVERTGGAKAPNMLQAGLYAGVRHYLKAIEAAGTDEAQAVAKKMRELPVNDFYNKDVKLREDGRVMHKMYLMQVKSPAESKHKFDYYKLVSEIPAEEAFRPLDAGGCPLVTKKAG